MQWRVCAYCARLLPGNDRGDVEHFRPKAKVAGDPQHGGYWWLAYKLSNYVLSCGVCNSNRKGNKFPLRPGASRSTFEHRSQVEQEARLLLDPTRDPLDQWVTVNLDDNLVPLEARPGLASTEKRQVEATIEFFRINRDRFLIDERLIVLDHVTRALETGETQKAKMMAVRFSPHSLVATAVLSRTRPDFLPTPSDEIDWLIDRLLKELEQLLAILERDPEDDRSKLELEETYWCLATLLKAPHDDIVTRVRQIYTDHGILEEIQPLAAQL